MNHARHIKPETIAAVVAAAWMVLMVAFTALDASATDMSKGNPKARIEVIQYASSTCPHCGHWKETVWPGFEKKYIKTGKVKFTFREVATAPANVAYGVYMLGHCAADKPPAKMTPSAAYFTVIDGFFAAQKQVFETKDALPTLKDLAARVGMDDAAFAACLTDKARLEAIENRIRSTTEADNVDTTPTFFVNGVRLTGGTELKDFDAAIKAAQKTTKTKS